MAGSQLSITRPNTGRPIIRDGRPRHPKAHIVGEHGRRMKLPYAPTGADLGGWATEWSKIDRPGRKAVVVRDGAGLKTLALDVLLAGEDHQDSIEGLLNQLRTLSESRDRITLVNLSPSERGPWRLESVSVAATLRQHGTNYITRAAVSLSFVEASDARPRLGPVSGGKRNNPKPTKPRKYVIKKGDTLRKLAARFYGEPKEWKRIARANKIKHPNRLKVGRRITIPADDGPK